MNIDGIVCGKFCEGQLLDPGGWTALHIRLQEAVRDPDGDLRLLIGLGVKVSAEPKTSSPKRENSSSQNLLTNFRSQSEMITSGIPCNGKTLSTNYRIAGGSH